MTKFQVNAKDNNLLHLHQSFPRVLLGSGMIQIEGILMS